MKENGIKHHQISMPGNKEPFVKIPPQAIKTALGVILDRRNHPVLIHCNKGKVS
jgi:tyrosine-protein phosphatase SIW14